MSRFGFLDEASMYKVPLQNVGCHAVVQAQLSLCLGSLWLLPMRENECEELVLESSVLWGTCGWVVAEMKDQQKLRCDEFVGEDVAVTGKSGWFAGSGTPFLAMGRRSRDLLPVGWWISTLPVIY